MHKIDKKLFLPIDPLQHPRIEQMRDLHILETFREINNKIILLEFIKTAMRALIKHIPNLQHHL